MKTSFPPTRPFESCSFVFIFSLVTVPQSAAAAQTITVAPTQPVYLVDNGDTAQVGFS